MLYFSSQNYNFFSRRSGVLEKTNTGDGKPTYLEVWDNDKPLEKITSSSYHIEQKHSSKRVESITYAPKKDLLQLLLLKVCMSFRFGQIKKLEVYFGLYESSFTFIEKRRPNKYCLCEVNLISYM